jgi:hypothetical protein
VRTMVPRIVPLRPLGCLIYDPLLFISAITKPPRREDEEITLGNYEGMRNRKARP